MDFCHCHVHSVYSILDGINKLDALVARVKELGMTACALTDHGNLHGMIDFYKECKKGGVKPIIGIECYITADPDGAEEDYKKTRDNHHMVLMAQNNKGLENLFWLLSNGNLNNFYYKPRINVNTLKGRAEGLVATSACVGGVVAQQGEFFQSEDGKGWFRDNDDKALRMAKDLQDAFQGRFYLEIQDQDMWEQTALNEFLVALGKREKIPLVISADAHYLKKEDRETHAMIMAQQLKKTIEEYESGSEMKYGNGFYIKSPQEMLDGAIKHGAEEAFWNTTEIAKMCNVEIELGKYKMPNFDVTKAEDYNEFKQYKASGRIECTTKGG